MLLNWILVPREIPAFFNLFVVFFSSVGRRSSAKTGKLDENERFEEIFDPFADWLVNFRARERYQVFKEFSH